MIRPETLVPGRDFTAASNSRAGKLGDGRRARSERCDLTIVQHRLCDCADSRRRRRRKRRCPRSDKGRGGEEYRRLRRCRRATRLLVAQTARTRRSVRRRRSGLDEVVETQQRQRGNQQRANGRHGRSANHRGATIHRARADFKRPLRHGPGIRRRLSCYSERTMRHWRAAVAVLAVVVWVLSAPLAMASSHCMGMGAMCEGPCGTSSCVVSTSAARAASQLVSAGFPVPAVHVPDPPTVVLELPPK